MSFPPEDFELPIGSECDVHQIDIWDQWIEKDQNNFEVQKTLHKWKIWLSLRPSWFKPQFYGKFRVKSKSFCSEKTLRFAKSLSEGWPGSDENGQI